MHPATPVERRAASHTSPASFARELADRSRPVVLTGALDGWAASARWTFEWFAARHGAHEVPVQRWRSRRFEDVRFASMPLAEYLRRITRSTRDIGEDRDERLHLAGHCLLRELPALWADIAVPPYVGRLDDDQPFVFFSGAGTVTPLHHDLCHNFYAQLCGRKRFTLFSPGQGRALHAPALFREAAWTSPVDVEAPDYQRHPRARGARPLEASLGPGEVLFIPGGYWHAVRTLEHSIAVAFFWEHGLRQRALRSMLRALGRPAT